ncbi:hypothetical protein [Methylobacterium nodulans]|nr:hypothetical protein [Methylobacterium nodulans]
MRASAEWVHSHASNVSNYASTTQSLSLDFSRVQSLPLSLPSLSDLRDRSPSLPSLTGWLREANLAPGSVVDLRAAIRNGWTSLSDDQRWWADFAITATGVGAIVGWASFGCAVVVTPGGPVLMALASGACATFAAQSGTDLVKAGYERFAGRSAIESAVEAGKLAGITFGAILGGAGAGQFLAWQRFRHFKDFQGYARAARSLTRQSLTPVKPSVQLLRGRGYDIDHVIPVKCGWTMKIAPEVIGSLSNLHALPASINRSIGSKGC